MQLRAARMRVLRRTLGVANEAADPGYALFLTGADLSVRDFTKLRDEIATRADVSGPLAARGRAPCRSA